MPPRMIGAQHDIPLQQTGFIGPLRTDGLCGGVVSQVGLK
jgi:hypothetical protein